MFQLIDMNFYLKLVKIGSSRLVPHPGWLTKPTRKSSRSIQLLFWIGFVNQPGWGTDLEE